MLCPTTASVLKESTVLTKLKLRCCDIDAEGTSELTEALSGIKTLSELDLSWNTVNSQGAGYLGKLVVGSGVIGKCVALDCVGLLHPTGKSQIFWCQHVN